MRQRWQLQQALIEGLKQQGNYEAEFVPGNINKTFYNLKRQEPDANVPSMSNWAHHWVASLSSIATIGAHMWHC